MHQLEILWNLNTLKPVNNLTYNYVLAGFQNEIPVILKISLDFQGLEREANALEAFKGYGVVSVLKKQKNALLLQQAFPGYSLKNSQYNKGKKNIEIACSVAQRLHKAPSPQKANFPHLLDWLIALNKDCKIPMEHLSRARKLKPKLLEITSLPILLHSDLHQGNILSHGDDWLVIDPKGVMDYPINELWACIEEPNYDLRYISKYFGYPFDHVVKWYYVRFF